MSKDNKTMWINNISNLISEIADLETIQFILSKYKASTIEELSDFDLPSVFNELQAILTD